MHRCGAHSEANTFCALHGEGFEHSGEAICQLQARDIDSDVIRCIECVGRLKNVQKYIQEEIKCKLTLRLLISYTYMELLVKPEMLTSYIYGPTFGNAETVSFYLLHNVSTLNQCREVSCVTFMCKHFAS